MADQQFMGWTSPFRVMGVQFRIHISWFVVAFLITTSLASDALPTIYAGLAKQAYWTMAAIIIVGLALSILLHEMAHSLVARSQGLMVDRITLFLFGGVAELHEEPRKPWVELTMALAGPMFSVVLSVVLAVAANLSETANAPEALIGALSYLAALNLALAVFNMLPAFPMDGGRVLRAAIWMITKSAERATRIAASIAEGFAILMIGGGLTLSVVGEGGGGLWWVLIGFFLLVAARGAKNDLETKSVFKGRPIDGMMVRRVETIPADMTLRDFVEERLLASHHGLYPVRAGENWVGVLEPAQVLQVPREAWATTRVGDICTPAKLAPVVSPTDDAASVLERMQRERAPRLLVVASGDVVGVVTLTDLQTRLLLERTFHPRAA